MKRILTIITTQFVPYGGLTTVAMNYYRQLDHSNFRMDFASTNDVPEGLKQELEASGDSYHKLPGRKNILKYYTELKTLCRSYDIVHVHANSATATIELKAAQAAGVKKRIIHIHNTTCSHMAIHKLLKPIFDKTYTDAIACSRAAGEWIFPDGKYLVLNNAIDVKRYAYSDQNAEEIKKQYGLGNTKVIGNVGKLIEQKNHEFLLRCFAMLHEKNPDTVLLLVGDGNKRSELEKQAEELGIKDRVVFTGMVNAAEKYLSAMDCFAFPSRWEGLPLSVLEAQANGLKCIISDKVTREVDLSGTLQFLSIEGTEEQWADVILENLDYDRKKNTEKMCESLRKNNYDITTNVSQLEHIYMKR